MKTYSAESVAARFNVSIRRLTTIVKNANKLGVAIDKVRSDEMQSLIHNLEAGNRLYPISENLYEILIEQYKELGNIISISDAASEYGVKKSSLERYIKKTMGGGASAR